MVEVERHLSSTPTLVVLGLRGKVAKNIFWFGHIRAHVGGRHARLRLIT